MNSSLYTSISIEELTSGDNSSNKMLEVKVSAWENYLDRKWSLFSWYANFRISGQGATIVEAKPGTNFGIDNSLYIVDSNSLSILPLGSTTNGFLASESSDDFVIAIMTVELKEEINSDNPLKIYVAKQSGDYPSKDTITGSKGVAITPSLEGDRSSEIGEIEISIDSPISNILRFEQQGYRATLSPTALNLSAISFNENIAAASAVATLSSTDPDAADTFTYALAAGTGDTDNAAFTIDGTQLKIKAAPDYETKNSYSIRLKTTDAAGLSLEKAITFNVNNVNEIPTTLNVSASTFNENITAASAVATLSSTDPDAADTFTYTLASGTGDTDNASFTIDGNQLKIKAAPDFETKNAYSIRIKTTDAAVLSIEKAVTLSVNNINEIPTALNLSASTFNENIAAASVIATLSSSDPDVADTFTYAFISGSGDTDNASFTIDGNQLKIKAAPDFESKSSYNIRLKTTDAGGLSIEKAVILNVNNINEISTYTLTPSAAAINEGSTLTTSVATTNVASDTTLYYSFSGNGITSADFSSGALTGSGTVGTDGKLLISHTPANDLTTEGTETVELRLFLDAARKVQVGDSASVSIADTSINPFNLDIDGDGKITALGDGLMVIRKLFGAAFAGDALTNKAMSPTSTRTTAEIHEFIQQGITTGCLDVDKDGKTTALGDGLMVIRHLFGAAFANEALTNKAISPSSPYFGPPINHAAVAANIDAMRPA